MSYAPIAPAVRKRAVISLTEAEREEISRGLAAGQTMRSMAIHLSRSPSTVSREIGRHGGVLGYRAKSADSEAWEAARRPKICLLASNLRLQAAVTSKLKLRWSPDQISKGLAMFYPNDPTMRVSHETIYR